MLKHNPFDIKFKSIKRVKLHVCIRVYTDTLSKWAEPWTQRWLYNHFRGSLSIKLPRMNFSPTLLNLTGTRPSYVFIISRTNFSRILSPEIPGPHVWPTLTFGLQDYPFWGSDLEFSKDQKWHRDSESVKIFKVGYWVIFLVYFTVHRIYSIT